MSRLFVAALLAGMTASAQAATFGVVPQAGLAGVGATVQWGFTPYLAMTAGYTGLTVNARDVKTDSATYNGDLNLSNPQLFLNWAPFGGNFRLSAGVVNQQSNYDLTASNLTGPNSEFVDSVNIKADYTESIAPALTFGWESSIMATGLGYHFSIGAMYAGEPDVKATPKCRGANTPSEDAACMTYTASERKKVEDELKQYKVLPILQAGLIYRM